MKRRLLATFLSLCLLVGLLPTVALAEESPASETQGESSEQQATATDSTHVSTTDILSGNSTDGTMSGTCGATEQDNVRWTLNKNGETVTIDGEPKDAYTLTISGTGEMMDLEVLGVTDENTPQEQWTKDTRPWGAYIYNITKVIVEEGVLNIGKRSLKCAKNLAEVNLPNGLEVIGYQAFHYCNELKELTIPSSVNEIMQSAFQGTGIENLVIPESVRIIGPYAFFGCSSLSSVEINNGVEQIGTQAFALTAITDIKIPDTVISLGSGTFYNCKQLEKASLPSALSEIPSQLFQFSGIKYLSLPNTLTKIGENAFLTSKLEAIFIPSSVTSIAQKAFLSLADKSVIYLATQQQSQLMTTSNFSNSKTALAVTNGGTFAEGTAFKTGQLATPTKAEYSFQGWYTTEAFQDNTKVTNNVATPGQTYYAKWTESAYSVSTESVDFGTITYGSAVEAKTITITGSGGNSPLTAESSNDAIFTVDVDVIDSTVSVKPRENLGVGTYNEVITITTPDDATFFVDVSITIEQAPTSIGITAKPTSLTGGGTVTLTVTKTGLPQDAQVSVSGYSNIIDNGDGTYTVILPNTTASYTFTAKYEGDVNHEAATAVCTVSVTQYTPPVMDNPPSSGSGYLVSLDGATDGGTVTVRPVRADQGELVTITVTPDPGYVLDSLTVQKANGTAVPLTKVSDSVYTFQMPDSRVTVSATFKAAPVHSFTDVKPADYYYDAVLWAAANGVTNGITATTFGPELAVSRAQMVTFLWRAHGSPKATGANPFTDVSTSDYYYDAVLWAVANGVTKGTSSTTFSPDAAVTRAQAVTFQWRAAGSDTVSGSSFGDVAADAYYVNAVTWAVANGITNGTSSTTFSPDAVVTRAQAVAFLYRAAQ